MEFKHTTILEKIMQEKAKGVQDGKILSSVILSKNEYVGLMANLQDKALCKQWNINDFSISDPLNSYVGDIKIKVINEVNIRDSF